jgi:cell division protein FtsB
MRKMIVRNEIKFSNLKNKMTENILQTKSKVTELNIQYMDVSSKLTLLQNHQLLIQLEYQSQQLDDLKEKNKKLEKEVYDLTKEVEIHKEVELALAEKNKDLSQKNNSYISILNSSPNDNIKNKIIENENNYNNEEDKDNFNIYRKTISFNNMKYNNRSNFTNNSILNSNIFNNGSLNINNEKSRIIKLEKKLLNLEKQLVTTKKEYNDLKDKNEYIENVLKNYENKYTGLFNFLEECLKKFFDDEQLKKNKEIYINIDSIHKGDFSALNKEEKYSTLIILMKHLMPLMNSKNISYKQNSIDNISLKFHEINAPKVQKSVSVRKSKKIKKYIMNTTNNFYNGSKKISRILNNKNELESLPSIRKVELSGSQLIRSKILNKQ